MLAAIWHLMFTADLWYIPTKSAITCWVAMTDVEEDNGTLEYIPGSHNWPDMAAIPRDEFHVEGSHYRSTAYEYAKRAGVDVSAVKFEKAIAPAGSIVFHHGKMFHGSDKNRRADVWRRSLGVHLIPSDSKHGSNDGYIYGRYKRFGDSTMDETYFPITWTPTGYRSPVIKPFLLGHPY
jgi:phytanoyl-CoA hydroxylase